MKSFKIYKDALMIRKILFILLFVLPNVSVASRSLLEGMQLENIHFIPGTRGVSDIPWAISDQVLLSAASLSSRWGC